MKKLLLLTIMMLALSAKSQLIQNTPTKFSVSLGAPTLASPSINQRGFFNYFPSVEKIAIYNNTTWQYLLTENLAATSYYPLSTNPSNYLTSSALVNYVPTSRTITINGTTYDLSNNRSWTISADVSSGVVSSAATLTVDVTKEYQVFSGTTSTWTLPVITGNTWKRIFIKNRGSGVLTINANGGTNTIYFTAAVNTIALNPGDAIILINDSTYWNVN